MADSPDINDEGVVAVTILAGGDEIADTIELLKVSIRQCVNRVPVAILEFVDGDMPAKKFPLSDEDTFKPGVELEIKVGYATDVKTIFKGMIIRHDIRIDRRQGSRLRIECQDKAVAMTVGRKNATFTDNTDSQVIKQLIGNYAGLRSAVDDSHVQHSELVQYYCSDWDFMLARAEAIGMLVVVNGGELKVAAPNGSSASVLSVTYGEDLIEFAAGIDARTQMEEVKAVSWDVDKQQCVEQVAKAEQLAALGNLQSAELAEVIALPSFLMQTDAPQTEAYLQAWAKGQQLRSALARIQGRMRFQGSALAQAGVWIDVAGVGERFNGKVYAANVRHEITGGNWVTDVEFGLPERHVSTASDIMAPPAAGLLPGVEGLQTGLVKKLDEDPDGNFRLYVKLTWQAENEGVWARLVGDYASAGFGAFVLPEIGDEVVLGFVNNDPSHPVILGSLYSSQRAAPYQPDAENNVKALVTRSGMKVEFDEEKKAITLLTPAQNKLVLSDDEKAIVLQDQHGNRIELNEKGLLLHSTKDITVEADGGVSISAIDNASLSSQANIEAQAMNNISHKANVGFSAEGAASAELKASGQTTVKGGIVMIN